MSAGILHCPAAHHITIFCLVHSIGKICYVMLIDGYDANGKEEFMIHNYTFNGLPVRTGDLICTIDGRESIIAGQFWRLIGKLIPGDVDHIVIYVGPEGRCVEAGAKGCVITFEAKNRKWDAYEMEPQRSLIDTLYGVAYPLKDKIFSEDAEAKIRKSVAN